MTTLQQALHIFRKDARHLRLEIGGALLLILILILSGVQTWEQLQESGRPDFGDDTPLTVLLPLVWGLLIARSIQSEALPGDRHFWLTRPYSRPGLVLGKVLFIAAFVNVPLMAAQAVIILADGLPLPMGGLLWNQALLTTIFVLPVTAIATLTRNLAQFLPAAMLSVAVLVAILQSGPMPDLAWVSVSLGVALLTTIGAFVIWRQYRLRRSGNTALVALGACVASLILSASFPDQAAFAIQSKLIGTPEKQFAMKLAPPEPKAAAKGRTPNKYSQSVRLPISVEGTEMRNLMVQSWDLSFKTLSGVTRHGRTRVAFSPTLMMQDATVDREFYEAAKNAPVTVRVEYSLTLFGNAGSADVPLDGTPVVVPGMGQCGAVVQWDHREFFCRSAFRGPGIFVSDRVAPVSDGLPTYTPVQWRVHLNPVTTRAYRLSGGLAKELAPATPEEPAKLTARERVAYFRYTLEVPNVRLADYAIDSAGDEQ